MSRTLCLAAQRLESGRPLAFTYHHNQLDAYIPLAVAMLDSKMVCSASFPCPAEMGASIHINGTESSIVDTVFVCRSTGSVPRRWISDSARGVSDILKRDIEDLSAGGLSVTQGDIRFVCFGHLILLAVWFLRKEWDATQPISERLDKVGKWLKMFGGVDAV
jgi:adenine-specific DNA methylase